MKKLKKLLKIFLYLSFALIVFLVYAYLESRWIKMNEIEIVDTDIPNSFVGKKIAFVSDIHHGPYFSVEEVDEMVEMINEQNPDIIILGGDYVHREPKYIKPFFDSIKKLKAKYGIYGVLGNHDHWESKELNEELFKRNGIKQCDNKSHWLKIENDSIKIGGVGDMWEDIQILDSTSHDLHEDDFAILISHNPDFLEKMNSNCIDLTLSGHTHGGQVTLFGFWAPIIPTYTGNKYRYGLKKYGNLQAYITSGVGTITPPVRFFCRPEIVIFELKKVEKN